MADESARKRLPFEPVRKPKKQDKTPASSPGTQTSRPKALKGTGSSSPTPTAKVAPSPSAKASAQVSSKGTSKGPKPTPSRYTQAETRIPDAVGRRMLRRMLTFSGIPTGLGVVIFFVSYGLIVRQVVDLPNVAVLLVTMGCFGLGVAGLSYGALSSSWDENRLGSVLGVEEFKINFARLTNAWREWRESRRPSSDSADES